MSSQGEEELKPCPFCGNIPIKHIKWGQIRGVWCDCSISEKAWSYTDTIEKWNDAYCWKALSQSQKDAKALVEALKTYGQHLPNCSASHRRTVCVCGFDEALAAYSRSNIKDENQEKKA